MRALFGLVSILLALCVSAPVQGQGVVLANSDPVVTINSTFSGETITLFGNIEPGRGGVPETGPYEVIVLVKGPSSDRVLREKKRRFGVMLNTGQTVYSYLPGYYAVLASGDLPDIADSQTRQNPLLSLPGVAGLSRTGKTDGGHDRELIRLMTQSGLFVTNQRGVSFLSPTTFSARILLPSNAPSGPYIAQALVFANDRLVGTSDTGFLVRTEGFERFLSRMAQDRPVLYGLAAVFLAIGTGWLGGVLFRR